MDIKLLLLKLNSEKEEIDISFKDSIIGPQTFNEEDIIDIRCVGVTWSMMTIRNDEMTAYKLENFDLNDILDLLNQYSIRMGLQKKSRSKRKGWKYFVFGGDDDLKKRLKHSLRYFES